MCKRVLCTSLNYKNKIICIAYNYKFICCWCQFPFVSLINRPKNSFFVYLSCYLFYVYLFIQGSQVC